MLDLLVYAALIWAALTALTAAVLLVVTMAEQIGLLHSPAKVARQREHLARTLEMSNYSESVGWTAQVRSAKREPAARADAETASVR
jgi:hypothetical protein